MNKIMKSIVSLVLLSALLLGGCQAVPAETQGSTTAPQPQEITYTVTVVDGQGDPVTSGVVVSFNQKGEQAAMQPVDGFGKAEKKLPAGEYAVVLQFTDSNASYYYEEGRLLTPEKNQIQIQLITALNGDPIQVYDNNGQSNAYAVETGSTYVKLEDGKRNYFLFAPKAPGTYRFSTSDVNAVPGHYGYTAYILGNSLAELADNAFTISVTSSMIGGEGGTNPFVIGVDANGLNDCVLTIERIGDPEYSIEENEPWIIYKPTVELHKFSTPAGTIQQFDLTADSNAYPIVFNEADQTYHLNTADGPQILVQLAKDTDYMGALSEICTTTGIKKYFYDADGNFVKREDYTECLQIYSCTKVPSEGDRAQSAGTEVYLDPQTGLYPLTEDLYYIIRNHGGYVGWWDAASPGYLFKDADGNNLPDINPDIAWLFLCCYVEP